MAMKRITIIGCGPGDTGQLTGIAKVALSHATTVVGAQSLLDRLVPAGVEMIPVHCDVAAVLDQIESLGERSIAVLVTGDPGICSLATSVIKRFGREACRVLPGISSVQAAFAALGMDWTDARIVGGHANAPRYAPADLRNEMRIAVLTGHPETPSWLQQLATLPGCHWNIHACRDLTLFTERIEEITPERLLEAAWTSRTVIVLEKSDAGRQTPGRDDMFPAPRPASLGTFFGIGTGPGDSGWITVRGARILAQCPHIFAPKARIKSESLARSIAQEHIGSHATVHEQLFPMTKDEDELSERWQAAAEEVAAVLERGEDACFLTIGDPMLYSTYVYLLRALQQRLPELAVETVPGVTSFCAAASRTNFTLGERKEPLTIIPAADDLSAVEEAISRDGTVVLMKIGGRLPEILTLLEKHNVMDDAVLVARAGQPEERIITNLRSLPPEDHDVGYLSVILIHVKSDGTPASGVQSRASSSIVTFVGAGPGDPELMTLKAARLLQSCQCCIYAGSLVSPDVIALLPEDCEKYDSAEMTLEQTTEACRSGIERGLSVVRLHSGDPSIYGAIREQMNDLDKLGIGYEVVPGVSSFQASAAALKTELTAPEVSQTIILTRDSGRTPLPPEQELSKLGAAKATLCIFLSIHGINKVVDALIPHYGDACPAAVVYRASWPDQQIVRGTLADLAEKVKAAQISRTAMIVVGEALQRDIPVSKLYDADFTHGYRKGTES